MTGRNQTIALVGAIAIAGLVIVGILYAVVAGRPLDSFMPTLLGFATPTLTTLFVAAGLNRHIGQVDEKVNGHYSTMLDRNAELESNIVQLADQIAARQASATAARDASTARHARPDDDEQRVHLSGDTVAVDASGLVAHASATERTVTGLVLPWNTSGATTAGPLTIRRGAVRLPRDLSRCKLHFRHTGTPGHAPVGYATAYEVRDDGLHMTFRVARTPDGDAAIVQITEGVYNAFSAELAGILRDGNTVTDSIMTGVALVDTPAFADARISSVQAQHTPNPLGDNTMNVRQYIAALIAAGATEAEARTAALARFSQAEVDGVTSAELAADAPPAPTEAVPPVATPPAAPAAPEAAPATAAAAYTPARPAIVPAGAPAAPPAAVHLSAYEAAQTVALMVSGHGADVAHAALANITNSALVDATPPQWLGELWSGPARTRRLIPLLNRRDLRSWRIQGFRWTQKPLVATYGGDKAEIPTNPVALAPYEAEAVRWAGGHDLDRKFFDFNDAGILESYWRAMHESYAIVTDTAAGAWLVANAATIVDPAATDLLNAMIAAHTAIDDALLVPPSYYIANPADKRSLLTPTVQTMPAFWDIFGVNPRSIVWSKAVPAGTLVAGAKPAATFYELPGSPLRVEAEHLSHGGRDRAMFGYSALTLDNGAGLVKIDFAP